MKMFIFVTILLLFSVVAATETEFVPDCEIGSFLVCHFFPLDDNKIPIELCVSESNLGPHLQYYPEDTEGPCPQRPIPTVACPLECGTFCSLTCRNLINDTSPTTNQNVDCFDCQGTPGYPGRDGRNGIQCWDQNENQECDLSVEDLNHDEACTLADCRRLVEPPVSGCVCPEPIKLCCYVSLFGKDPPASNPSPILGQIRWIAWNDCTTDLQNHAPCQGQLLAAIQHGALFSLMRTKYGGDGVVSFALPDFQNMKL